MKQATCILLEPSDMTKDGNLRSEAFEAICNASLVVHGSKVIKNHVNLQEAQEATQQSFIEKLANAGPATPEPDPES
jgi:hypothetical protein